MIDMSTVRCGDSVRWRDGQTHEVQSIFHNPHVDFYTYDVTFLFWKIAYSKEGRGHPSIDCDQDIAEILPSPNP